MRGPAATQAIFHCKCIKNLALCKSRGNFHVVLKIIFPVGDYSVYPAQFFSDYFFLPFLLCSFNVLSVNFSGIFSETSVYEAKKQTKTNKKVNKY